MPVRVPLSSELRATIKAAVIEEDYEDDVEIGAPYTALVDFFSAVPNGVVLRMPGRRYPGVLIQGDDLSGLIAKAEKACAEAEKAYALAPTGEAAFDLFGTLRLLRDDLVSIFEHYRKVTAGKVPSPFGDAN